jgi:hypothetical protein
MLTVHAGWDWFSEVPSPEEKAAMDNGQLCAIVREDGDDNAAIIAVVTSIKAPPEHVKFATLDPCVADCFLAVAWDDRAVDVIMEDDENDEDDG